MPDTALRHKLGATVILTLLASTVLTNIARADITLPVPKKGDVIRVELHGYEQLEKFFNDLGYTPEAWDAGERTIPRLFL
ncbi:hypothetical protein, partial [Paremcibacter congregatus]|uniref:hypothetical protein n=1 Tax=Paremcibacter congregatus TaxID=2043170 RepID=UPI003A9566B0